MEFSGSVLLPNEAEMLVRQLKPFALDQIGNEEWKSQRENMERLNMCTHSNAVQKVDDFVKAYVVDHEKLPCLLHELLVMEVWRQQVLPDVMEPVAENPTAAYMYAYYESVLVNFLECICFHEEVVLAFQDDVLELIDYCWRQLYRLFSLPHVNEVQPVQSAEELARESARERLDKQLREMSVSRALACLSILWFVIDRLDALPISATNSVLQKNDLPVGLAEMMVLQPWQRRSSSCTQKFVSGQFAEVKGDEVMRVCVPEAHAWFCLHKLLCDPDCRRKYGYTQHNKELILRVRRFLNDTLVDQIPALENVQRALEELSFMEPPSGTEEKFKSTLIIEQVPRLLSSIVDSRKEPVGTKMSWSQQADRMRRLLTDPEQRARDAMRMARIFDQMFEKE